MAAGEDALWFGARRPEAAGPQAADAIASSSPPTTLTRSVDIGGQASFLLHAGSHAVRLGRARRRRRGGSESTRRPRLAHRRTQGQPAVHGLARPPRARRQDAVGAADSARGARPRRCRHADAERIPARAAAGAEPRAGGRRRVRLGHRSRRGRGAAHRPGHAAGSLRCTWAGSRSGSPSPAATSGSPTASEAPSRASTRERFGRSANPSGSARRRARLRSPAATSSSAAPDSGTVTRIDVRSGRKAGAPIRFAPPADALRVRAGACGNVGLGEQLRLDAPSRASARRRRGAPVPAATVSKALLEIPGQGPFPRGARVIATISVPPWPPQTGALAIGEGAVWSLNPSSRQAAANRSQDELGREADCGRCVRRRRCRGWVGLADESGGEHGRPDGREDLQGARDDSGRQEPTRDRRDGAGRVGRQQRGRDARHPQHQPHRPGHEQGRGDDPARARDCVLRCCTWG